MNDVVNPSSNLVPLPAWNGLITSLPAPRWITRAGPQAEQRYFEFFAASIRNAGTREAYARAVQRLGDWCETHGIELIALSPIVVATHIEQLQRELAAPTVKLHLAAIRMFCDYLVLGHVLHVNPAASVKGPKHIVKIGKTPVLEPEDARRLLDSIETDTVIGLRDRAVIGVMVYSFARVSAVCGLNGEDYFAKGRQMWFRFEEKGSKIHEIPAHHKAVEFIDAYLAAAVPLSGKRMPLFRTINESRQLSASRMHRTDVLRMIKRRASQAGLNPNIGCHTFRATGITAYLKNGGTLENAQKIANHESSRTTALYDRRHEGLSLDEIERVRI